MQQEHLENGRALAGDAERPENVLEPRSIGNRGHVAAAPEPSDKGIPKDGGLG